MRGNRVLSRLDEMLTEAINGSFAESCYDETELSRLESKFRQYLTERELAAERVQAERAAIKELVTDISHQTKTPIANICLYTQLLEEKSPQELKPYVQQIHQQAEKLEFLIQALARISRLESGVIRLEPRPCRVWELIEKSVRQMQEKARARQITIYADEEKDEKEDAGKPYQIWEDGQTQAFSDMQAVCDMGWTQEALGNLLDNGIKYSPEGSRIRVRVRGFEMFVRISVEDEGPGILEEEQAQIFERFYRGKNAGEQEGSGVGLYLTRMILQKERGYIRVCAGARGGSRFQMYLPRQ